MSEQFIGGPDGQYNLRYIRKIYSGARGADRKLYAVLDDHQLVQLYVKSVPSGLSETIVHGTGTARVVHWTLGDSDPLPEELAEDCLHWTTTKIIGWRVSIEDEDQPPTPILVDPPAANGAYVILEPNGEFVVPYEARLDEAKLMQWALDSARLAAKQENAKRVRERERAELEQS